MSRLITAPLDTSQFLNADGDKPFELEVWSYWYDGGYPVESVVEAYTVIHEKTDDENTSHIVAKVETLSKPLDVADVAVDSTEKWVCDCKAYQFHHSVDLEKRFLSEWDPCKHVKAVSREERAKSDNNQRTL